MPLRESANVNNFLQANGSKRRIRITNNRKGAEKHLNRIKPYIPNTGTVRIMRLTEKQFCNMGLYQAEEDYQESIVGINDYIML